jgi:hypothetical protein
MSAMTRRLVTSMVVGLLALAVAAGCGGSDTPPSTRTTTVTPSTTSAEPSTTPTTTPTVAPEGWRALPEPPGAFGLINVWTGREVLASWSACCENMDGRVIHAYDPATRTWRSLPKFPLGSRHASAFVWTGQELLQVGGSRDRSDPEAKMFDDLVPVRNGMALDPDTGRWRAIADAPRDMPFIEWTVWTGSEAIFADSTSLLRYKPSSDRWTVGKPVPGEHRGSPAVVWTGDEVVVWGGGITRSDPDEPESQRGLSVRDGYAYNPATNRWRTVPAAPIGASGSIGVWTGEQVLVWGGTSTRNQGAEHYAQTQGASWDPRTGDWTLIPAAPTKNIPWYDLTGAWTGRELVVVTGNGTQAGQGAAFDPATWTWRAVPLPWDVRACALISVWTDRSLVVLPGSFCDSGWEYYPGY